MDKLKYIKLEREDGTYSDSIPLSVDSDHVDINGNTLTDELNNKASNSDVNLKVSNLQSQITGLASGSPLVASSINGMTDITRVYVNTTDGNWYYYNGSQWVVGGVYQGTSLDTEDEERIETLESEIFTINETPSIVGFIQSTGYFNPLASCRRTDYIDLKDYDKIECYNYLASNGYTLAFFDEGKTLLPSISVLGTGAKVKQTVNVPLLAKYVIFSNYQSQVSSPYIKLYKENSLKEKFEVIQNNIDELQNVTNILKNKKIGYLGDSITNGYLASLPFRTIITNTTGSTQYNYGINSSTLSNYNGGNNPVVERYQNMDDDLDYVCVLIGTNDTAPMGDENSSDTTTFYGALNTLIEGLITKYTTKKIMFMTLLPRRNASLISKNTAIKNRCEYYSIPCFDLFHYSNMNPNIDIVNNTLFANQDGLHPNDAGHQMLANKIQKWLESL